MQRFSWPGYEVQLVGELQRQQNSAQFCDTLLQTEGISVPTHSCVLAALSPYLCQRLSASPSPPSGQKRRLQLQTVTAQALLKLVGLLYSGELEVGGSKEQSDVLAAAHQFGIGHLVSGRKDGWVKGVGSHTESRIHAEEARQKHRGLKTQDAQVQAELNRGRETHPPVKKKSFTSIGTQTADSGVTSEFSSDQTPECQSFVGTVSIPLQPQSVTPDKRFGPSDHSESAVSQTNTSSSASSTSLNAHPSSPRPQEGSLSKQLSEAGDGAAAPNDEDEEDGGNAERPREADEKVAEEERRHSGGKSLKKMKRVEKMRETSQVSVKLKMRRRTEEAAWEVVILQDKDEAPPLPPPTSVDQDGSSPKPPQTDRRDAQTSASSVHNPETFLPVAATSPEAARHAGRSSELRSDATEAPPQPQGSVEEPDEEIDRMLDEIMMGLNILPSLNHGCQKAQTGRGGVQDFGQVPVPVLDDSAGSTHVHGALSEAGCVFYQDVRTQSADSGIHCCFEGQNQPGCAALSDDLLTPQQHSSEFTSSISSSGRSDSLFEDTSLCPQTAGSIFPSSCVPIEPKLHLPGLQPLSSQDDRPVLHFLPLSRGNEPQSAQTFSFPCTNGKRLPHLLSPLEPRSPEAQRQPRPDKSCINPENYVQPSLHRRPWLTEAPWSLHFPLLTLTEDKQPSGAQDSNTSCGSEQRYVGGKLNNGDTCAESMGGVKERRTTSQPEEESEPEKMKKRKHGATGDAAAPRKRKRRCEDFLQDSLGQYLESVPTFCSVSLSSNNVLSTERKRTASPSNKPCTKTSTITTTMDGNPVTEQTPIRTRGFVKRSQEIKSDEIPVKSVLVPVVCRTVVEGEQSVVAPKRRPGRPRKIRLDQPPSDGVPARTENRSHDEAGERHDPKDPKVETNGGGKKRGRKARRNTSEAEKTQSAERSGEAEGKNNGKDLKTDKQSWMATLWEFKKLLKRQRKSTESQERNESARREKQGDAPDGEAEVEIKESIKIQGSDENHNHLFSSSAAQRSDSHQDGTNDSGAQKKTCFAEDIWSSEDALEVEVLELPSEREQLLKKPDEGVSCWTGGSEAARSEIHDEAASHRNALSQRTGPPSPGADGLSVTSGCHREEEEEEEEEEKKQEEEEEEVDVLVFSPQRGPPVGAREDGPNSIVIISGDEEEEEDVNEIDVTGDEEAE